MKLVKPTQYHLSELMSWFANENELVSWGGPLFNYPFSAESFQQDLTLNDLSSYSLVCDDDKTLLAFGQFYPRLNKCHLGRLIVNPEHRGKGIVSTLVTQLIEIGQREFKTLSASLFVYDYNKSAIQSYQKLGFEFIEYPEPQAIEHCLYMVR